MQWIRCLQARLKCDRPYMLAMICGQYIMKPILRGRLYIPGLHDAMYYPYILQTIILS